LKITAGVLVGGDSQRMGFPKVQLPTPNGTTSIEHAVSLSSALAREVVLLGGNDALPDSLAHLLRLPDPQPEPGPLGGLFTLLKHIGKGWGLLLACDLPLLTLPLLKRLVSAIDDGVDAVAYLIGTELGYYHTCCALYHTRALPEAGRQLTQEEYSLQVLLRKLRVSTLTLSKEESRQLTNINTLADLKALPKYSTP
jgi:molybdopterin-guanine dinucleotide biosynthesis protein A